ncbi:hypothetical protein HaLaN_17736, partial [Haematococcus lacustris]
AELCTPQLGDVLVRCRSGLRSRYAVGLGRYAYHLPSLRKVLSGHNARLRPKLRVKEDALQAIAPPHSPGTGAKLPLLLCTADLDTLMICSQAM